METTFLILELLGTVAFTLSGAVAAIDNEMDLLGIEILGLTVAVGGGFIRDITLNIAPPNVFRQPIYLTVSLITTTLFLIGLLLWRKFGGFKKFVNTDHLLKAINASDAIGLGAFTVTGCEVAINMGHGENIPLVLFVGVISGVGGGVLRDIFTQKKPYIFVKHIYALASLMGAISFYLLHEHVDLNVASFASAGLVVLIRFIAAKYKLSLPRFKRPEDI